MTIPMRDELIERASKTCTEHRIYGAQVMLADFALAEIRRAVAEELEALRATRCLLPAIDMNDPYALGRHDEELTWANAIESRIAALRASQSEASQRPEGAMREQDSEYYASAGITGPGSESVKVREDAAAPALSDADVLERAAEIMTRNGDRHMQARNAHVCAVLEVAAKLRAASAPKPVDVFEAFERAAIRRVSFAHTWGAVARDWFGPLVEFAESVESSEELYPSLGAEARAALSALRKRAQEAS